MNILRPLLAAAAVACLAPAPALAQGVTGRYAVTLLTDTGACDARLSWSVGIVDGQIAETGLFVRASGQVSARGQVALRVVKGAETLSASGHMTDQGGNGTWTSPSRDCSGRWLAAKA